MQPEKLGPFRIGRMLGRGGMGAVYEGFHEETDEPVAVKVLLSTLEEDEDVRLRFEAEIDTLKRLRHPNIVRLFGFGEEEESLYYVMELVDGSSLHQEMRSQRLFQWHEVAKIGLEMCFALKHAHDRGITHRDIKPANILLERAGAVKLSDFGIAHFFGGQRLTEVHSVVGTLEYMSPEQALANPIGPRSDLYSLGAVLYALLVGKPPYTARNLPEIIRKHQVQAVESIRATRLDVPDELELIVFDLLKIRPEDRPNNAYLAVKRFQSLLQALVGPPEKIQVRPMDSETPTRPPAPSPRIPPRDEIGVKKIGLPRGVVVEGGIIDLGGIVSEPSETRLAESRDTRPGEEDNPSRPGTTTESETAFDLKTEDDAPEPSSRVPDSLDLASPFSRGATSLDVSFGRPGGEPIPEHSAKGSELTRWSDEDLTAQLRQDYRQLNIPLPEEAARVFDDDKTETGPEDGAAPPDVADRVDRSPESGESPEESAERRQTPVPWAKPPLPEAPPSPKTSFRSDIRQGELVWEDAPGFRRSKDEPIPDIEVFDALNRSSAEDLDDGFPGPSLAPVDPMAETPSQAVDVPQDLPTVDGLDALDGPPSPAVLAPSLPGAGHAASLCDGGDLYRLQDVSEPASTPETESASSPPTERSASTSRFVAVKDEELDDLSELEHRVQPLVSIQTVLASVCLILIGMAAWYMIQPVPPDTLFERIAGTIRESGEDEELSPGVLRRAEKDIRLFIRDYAMHPKAETVREFEEALNLADLERRLERRQQFANPTSLAPVERAYIEAVASLKTDPEKTIRKLQALIDLFSSDAALFHRLETSDEGFEPNMEPGEAAAAPETPSRRRLSSPTELCVELARRRLKRLNQDLTTIHADQIALIEKRLDDAQELEEQYPARAAEIRRAVVELYRDRSWARDVLREAREALEKERPRQGDRSVAP